MSALSKTVLALLRDCTGPVRSAPDDAMALAREVEALEQRVAELEAALEVLAEHDSSWANAFRRTRAALKGGG
jgi:uncharacterized protein YPO0396